MAAAPEPDEDAKVAALSAHLKGLPENIRLYTTLLADIEHVDYPDYDILSDDPRLWVRHYENARLRLRERPIETVQKDADTGDWDMMIELGMRYYTGCTIDKNLQQAKEILNLTHMMLEEELATPGGDYDGVGELMPLVYRLYGRMNLDTYHITHSSDDLFEAADKCLNALFFTQPSPAPIDLRVAKTVEETLGYIHAGRAANAPLQLRDLWDTWEEYKILGPGAFMCAKCKAPATPERKLMKCAGCPRWKKPSYCSTECQRAVRLAIPLPTAASSDIQLIGLESGPQERMREGESQSKRSQRAWYCWC
ncbi:hypothetical protein PENSPDRAFT_652373 [Peniophora sp. CONT]|nr:hypothetical protein PENSPDRAFT_652373 [Peniophora sp. CONT]